MKENEEQEPSVTEAEAELARVLSVLLDPEITRDQVDYLGPRWIIPFARELAAARATITDQSTRIAELERRVEELTEENARAVAFASKIERGDVKFTQQVDAIIQEIADLMSPHKSFHENLAQTVKRMLSHYRERAENAEAQLSQLRAEVERLKAEVKEGNEQWAENYRRASDRAGELLTEVERLTKERDDANRRGDELKRQRDKFIAKEEIRTYERDEWKRLHDDLATQLAEREEDRKDLDWLEAGLRQTDPKQQLVRIERGWKEPILNVITYDGRTTRQHTADTLRAAIRAARAQPEDGK